MTREEAVKIARGLRTDFKCESNTMVDFCNTIIKALEQEPTTKIEESNFSQEQYKADLQSAYDCGVASVKQEQRRGDVETLTKYFLGLVEVLRLHGIIHYSDMELITGTHETLEHNLKKAESEDKK